jgi:hypothetical protein
VADQAGAAEEAMMMLSTIGIIVGLGLSTIGISDLLLSHAQKEAIDSLATKLWNEVDEIKNLSFGERLTQAPISRTAIGLTGLLIVPGLYNTFHEGSLLDVIFGYSGFLLSVWIGPYVLDWAIKSDWRIVLLIVAAIGAMIGGAIISEVLFFAAFMMTVYYAIMRACYTIVLFICAECVSGAEFILRRVAEYPKGSVAAVGVILTFIAAVIKFLSDPSFI